MQEGHLSQFRWWSAGGGREIRLPFLLLLVFKCLFLKITLMPSSTFWCSTFCHSSNPNCHLLAISLRRKLCVLSSCIPSSVHEDDLGLYLTAHFPTMIHGPGAQQRILVLCLRLLWHPTSPELWKLGCHLYPASLMGQKAFPGLSDGLLTPGLFLCPLATEMSPETI